MFPVLFVLKLIRQEDVWWFFLRWTLPVLGWESQKVATASEEDGPLEKYILPEFSFFRPHTTPQRNGVV